MKMSSSAVVRGLVSLWACSHHKDKGQSDRAVKALTGHRALARGVSVGYSYYFGWSFPALRQPAPLGIARNEKAAQKWAFVFSTGRLDPPQ